MSRDRLRILLGILFICVLATIAALLFGRLALTPSRELRSKLGDDTIAILDGATSVETFRIDHRSFQGAEAKAREGPRIGGYLITSTGPAGDQALASELGFELLKDRTYFAKKHVACFNPGVAFRLWMGDEHVDILICFGCDNLRVI